jgi:hypothetical protein
VERDSRNGNKRAACDQPSASGGEEERARKEFSHHEHQTMPVQIIVRILVFISYFLSRLDYAFVFPQLDQTLTFIIVIPPQHQLAQHARGWSSRLGRHAERGSSPLSALLRASRTGGGGWRGDIHHRYCCTAALTPTNDLDT